MRNSLKFLYIFVATSILSGCDLFNSDTNEIHKKEYEPITGKFVLHESTHNYSECIDAYFIMDGSKGNFSLKYYENGTLKKEGQFQRVVTRTDKIGTSNDNLHFNVKCTDSIEHISTYTESFEPLNQFRIIEEYSGKDERYYLSELPFIMGTYVREGVEYQEESAPKRSSTATDFTCDLTGKFVLDDTHYFYFLFPEIDDYYAKAYFQYYSPDLSKPKEGFVYGKNYTSVTNRPEILLTYSRQVQIYKADSDSSQSILFGYFYFDQNGRMKETWGSVDLDGGHVNSFTFEYLSRNWTDEEMDKYTKDESYFPPDPKLYEYIGGTYTRA